MKKCLILTGILVMAFASFQSIPAQQRRVAAKLAATKTEVADTAKPNLRIAQGRVSAVDVKARTLTLARGKHGVTFIWDANTKMTVAAHAVKPSALISGTKVIVHYLKKGSKNWARSIVISPPTPAARER